MPMQYPPLADGTYRYGDEPQPLPSSTPGPESDPAVQAGLAPQFTPAPHPGTPLQFTPAPHASGPPHASAPPHPDDPPHSGTPHPDGTSLLADSAEQSEQAHKRSRDKLAAGAIVAVAGLVVVVVLGLAFFGPGSGPTTSPGGPGGPGVPGPAPAPSPGEVFAVEGRFTVVSSPGEPVSGDATGCELPLTLSDIGEGSSIALARQDGTHIGMSRLAYEDGDLSSCTFTFDFDEVPSGVGSYLIELDGRGQLVYSEQELRAGVEITLGR